MKQEKKDRIKVEDKKRDNIIKRIIKVLVNERKDNVS